MMMSWPPTRIWPVVPSGSSGRLTLAKMTDDLVSVARIVFLISLVPVGCIWVSMRETKCGCFRLSIASVACIFQVLLR